MATKRSYVGGSATAGYGGYTGPLLGGPTGNGIFDQNSNQKPTTTKPKPATTYRAPAATRPAGSLSAADVASAVALAGGPLPGNVQALLKYPAKPAAKPKPKAKAKAKAPAKAVARRVGVSTPAPPPVDPLDTLRGEYDKYLTDMYGGLNVSLEGIRTQYKTRSEELAARLKGIYDDSANVAGQTAQRTTDDMSAFAERMGLGQATQGRDTADWQATNERLKSLNEVNRANSTATNDTIRTNYYDFLGDKITSAKGQEAMSRGALNDVIVQAKLARQQALMAAAAARSRGSGGRGRGGSGGVSGSGTQTSKVANEEINAFLSSDAGMRSILMSQDPETSEYLKRYGTTTMKNPKGSDYSGNPKKQATYVMNSVKNKAAEEKAWAYLVAKKYGPITSSTVTNKIK